MALSCLLLPDRPGEFELPAGLAAFIHAPGPQGPWQVVTEALSLYRAGKFETVAVKLRPLAQSLPKGPFAIGQPVDAPVVGWLLLSMSCHQLGLAAEARSWLDKAAKRMEARSLDRMAYGSVPDMDVRAVCEVLHREAEELLANKR